MINYFIILKAFVLVIFKRLIMISKVILFETYRPRYTMADGSGFL